MPYLQNIQELFYDPIGKLLAAAVLGGILGWERERRGRPAGLRTHILVCIGVALMMIVSEYMFEKYNTLGADSIMRVDPARIAAQVVTGIGFLGAGTIMRFRTMVRGLTTAASLWTVAGIGLAVGSGCYLPAILTTILALIALLLLPLFEREIKRDKYKTLRLSISGTEFSLTPLLDMLKKNSMVLQHYGFERDLVRNEIFYHINVRYKDESLVLRVSDEIAKSIKEVRRLGWE